MERFVLSGRMMISLAGGVALLGGCAAGPVPVSALPGPNKDVASFNRDETACRTEAARAAYPASGAATAPAAAQPGNTNVVWDRFFSSYGKCEAAKGNYVQPVPWAVAYGLYLGIGLPTPALYFAPYPPPPWGPPVAYGYP
jgi:hypothetical protein